MKGLVKELVLRVENMERSSLNQSGITQHLRLSVPGSIFVGLKNPKIGPEFGPISCMILFLLATVTTSQLISLTNISRRNITRIMLLLVSFRRLQISCGVILSSTLLFIS